MKKIILTEKFKGHMVAHEKDFIIGYESLIKKFEKSPEFQKLDNNFCKVPFEFEEEIGFLSVIKIKQDESCIYAKRKERPLYSKFVKRNGERMKTNKALFILKKNNKNSNEYFLITMFPGEECEKEPQDKSIKDSIELKKCLEYWENRAFIYDESIVEKSTIQNEMPYLDLYKKIGVIKLVSSMYDDFIFIYSQKNDKYFIEYNYNDEWYYHISCIEICKDKLIKMKVFICNENKKILIDKLYYATEYVEKRWPIEWDDDFAMQICFNRAVDLIKHPRYRLYTLECIQKSL